MSASSPLVPINPPIGPTAAHGPSASPDSAAWDAAQQAAMGTTGGGVTVSAEPVQRVGPAPGVSTDVSTGTAEARAARASSNARAGVDVLAQGRSGIAGAASALPRQVVAVASPSSVAKANPRMPDSQIADPDTGDSSISDPAISHPGKQAAAGTSGVTRLPDRHGITDGDAGTPRDLDPSSHPVAGTPVAARDNKPSPVRTPDKQMNHDATPDAARASRDTHPTDDHGPRSDDPTAVSASDHDKSRTAPAVNTVPPADAGIAGQIAAGTGAGGDATVSMPRPVKSTQGDDFRVGSVTNGLRDAPDLALLDRLADVDTKRTVTSAVPAPPSGATALATPSPTDPTVVTPPSVQPNVNQPSIIHAATTLIGQGGGVAQVTIHPETLGPVTIQVAMTTTGAVHVLIQATTAAGYAAVNGSLAGMSTHLAQSGVAVATLRAENGGMASGQSGGHSQPQQSGARPSPAVRPLPAASSDAPDRDDGVMAYA
jgi:hypothetical protein